MFGCEVDIYGTQPRTFSPWQILKKRMRATPIGASVRRTRKRLKRLVQGASSPQSS